MLVELVPLRRLGAEQRASRRDEIGPLEVVLLVDQEVLLLGADGREHAHGLFVAEQAQGADRRLRQRVHGAQQRDLRVERLTRPRDERRRDAQQRTVGVLHDERGRGGVPGRVAAGLERRADAAGRERGGVGLALDELLARELGDRVAVAGRPVEGVVLLGGHPGQRLEPVREVRRALLERPPLHRLRDRVGQRGVERLALGKRRLQRLEDVLGQACALDVGAEDVGAEDLVAGDGQVRRAERATVGAPLGGRHVLLPDSAHGPPRGEGDDCNRASAPVALSSRTGRSGRDCPQRSSAAPITRGEVRWPIFRQRDKDSPRAAVDHEPRRRLHPIEEDA